MAHTNHAQCMIMIFMLHTTNNGQDKPAHLHLNGIYCMFTESLGIVGWCNDRLSQYYNAQNCLDLRCPHMVLEPFSCLMFGMLGILKSSDSVFNFTRMLP